MDINKAANSAMTGKNIPSIFKSKIQSAEKKINDAYSGMKAMDNEEKSWDKEIGQLKQEIAVNKAEAKKCGTHIKVSAAIGAIGFVALPVVAACSCGIIPIFAAIATVGGGTAGAIISYKNKEAHDTKAYRANSQIEHLERGRDINDIKRDSLEEEVKIASDEKQRIEGKLNKIQQDSDAMVEAAKPDEPEKKSFIKDIGKFIKIGGVTLRKNLRL